MGREGTYEQTTTHKVYLQGKAKFPTGGDAKASPRPYISAQSEGGSGATPEPTVKVWMKEGRLWCGWL
jgi:hypothetical protein